MKRMWMVGALALLVAALAAAPTSAAGGNSANANLCKNGGWRTVVQADATLFKNQGDCVAYAVRGGTPTAKTEAQILCESQGGTFKIIGPATHVRCTGTSYPDCAATPPTPQACDDAINASLNEVRNVADSLGVTVLSWSVEGWEVG